jgi:hypothetical protein
MTGTDFETYLEITNLASPLKPVEPAHARKLLHELAAWARSIGFPPHRDYPVVERSFGDVPADAPDVAFRFGCDGKPFYMPGPADPPSIVRNRLEQRMASISKRLRRRRRPDDIK